MSDEKPTPQPDIQKSLTDLKAEFTDKLVRQEATISSLTKQLTESLSGINTVIGRLASNKLTEGEDNGSNDDAIFQDEGDGEAWYENFKAAPSKEVSKLVEPKLNQLEAKIENKIKNTLATKDAVAKYDDMAYKQFPQLKEDTHPLRKETEKILAEEGKEFGSRPQAIYDAARMAYANLVQRGEIVPDSFKEEARRLLTIHDSEMYPFKSGTKKDEGELTKSQMHMAQRLGVSAEKYKQRLKQLGSRRGDQD